MFSFGQDFPILGLVLVDPLLPDARMVDIATQYNESTAVVDRLHMLYWKPFLSYFSMLFKPPRYFRRSLAEISSVWLNIYRPLVPES